MNATQGTDHDGGQVLALTRHESQWNLAPWFSSSVTDPGTAWKSKSQTIICMYGNSSQSTGVERIHTLFQSLEQQEAARPLLRRSARQVAKPGSPAVSGPGSAMRTGQDVIPESGHRPCCRGRGWLSAGCDVGAETKGWEEWGLAWAEGRAEGERRGCRSASRDPGVCRRGSAAPGPGRAPVRCALNVADWEAGPGPPS